MDIEPEGFLDGEEEEATSSGASYDVQEGNEESSADISGAEEESFNDRVNRNWENGEEDTLPEIKDYDAMQDEGDDVDYSSIFAYESPIGTLTLARELSPDMLPAQIPAYNPNGIAFNDYVVSDESVPRASGGNYERVFPSRIPVSENNTFAIGKPEATLMSNTGSKESGSGEAGEAQKITITEADRNIASQGAFDKGRTAVFYPDSQNVVNTDYRTYYDFGETPAKSILSGKLNNALETAIANDDSYSQQVIKITMENVNAYDDSAITSVYYLNDEDGAMSAGHSGILMVNTDGQGILFSFYPQSQNFPDGVFYSPSEMRISVLSGQGLDNFLKGSAVLSASTSGKKRTESYDRVLEYEITPEQGKAMFEQAVAIAGLGFSYDLAYRNCDHVALSILGSGDIDLWKWRLPNVSFGLPYSYENAKETVTKLWEYVKNVWK